MATAWQTAQWVASQSPTKGKKFYLVAGYEYWANADPDTRREIGETFRLGLCHIAISAVVERMLASCGATAEAIITPGIDHDVFYLSRPIESRPAASVAFPLRREPFKGTADAISAIGLAREMVPASMRVVGVGSVVPDQCPAWIQVLTRTTDRELRVLLNSVSLFVLPSHYEGLGLTGLEAMACGAAVVTTDSGGVLEYARDGHTAIVVPPRAPRRLAQAIVFLVGDQQRRWEIARRGRDKAHAFQWETATTALEAVLVRAA
jgi:glycosyltransferase involved in cell wall biosynthesis